MILVTGGAGYVGSHLVLKLLTMGFNVVVYDNLVNSSISNLKNMANSINHKGKFYFVEGCVLNQRRLERVFKSFKITRVFHLAGLKSIAESLVNEKQYLEVNVEGTKNVARLCIAYSVKSLIFSSSATVYRPKATGYYSEDDPLCDDCHPYAVSKIRAEAILNQAKRHDVSIDIVALRYFNPVGFDESGLIKCVDKKLYGLFPTIINRMLSGNMLNVWGNDYDTFDHTAIRDYIHVNDVVTAHLLVMDDFSFNPNLRVFNVGSAKAISVQQVIDEFNRQSGNQLRYRYMPRRQGDTVKSVANISKIQTEFGFSPTYDLTQMVSTTLNTIAKEA